MPTKKGVMSSTSPLARACLVLVVVLALAQLEPARAGRVGAALGEGDSRTVAPALVQFTSAGHALGFTTGSMVAATGRHALRVIFVDANAVQPQSATPLPSDGSPQGLVQITYANLWDGISLDYRAEPGRIYTTTYHLAPGANPRALRLQYNAPVSASSDGTLRIAYDDGALRESAPIAWQQIDGERVNVAVSFRVEGQQVSFALGAYDPAYALTIDPSLVWNSFLGGNGDDAGNDIALDAAGNVYVTGVSSASWGTPVRAYAGAQDAFVAKLDSSGSLLWNTFLGSANTESGLGIAVDGDGNTYVTGDSTARWGAPTHDFTAFCDGFVAKLDTHGVLVWNTFVGGYSFEHATDIALAGSNVLVSGWSDSDWSQDPTTFNYNAFAASLTATDGVLTWHTFLGGSGEDKSSSIAVNGSSGDVFVTGRSTATWGTPIRAYTSDVDTFVAKLGANGNLGWNTFLGGSKADESHGIAIDGSGNLLVIGVSTGTWGTPLRSYSGKQDAYVAKLTADGTLTWNTFLGGSQDDIGMGIAVSGDGSIHTTGMGGDGWGSPVETYKGGFDAFVATLSSGGAVLKNTNIGSASLDVGTGIAVNGTNSVVTGYSRGTWGAPVRVYATLNDAFVAKVVLNSSTPAITWSAPAPIVYGTALSGTQLNAAASFGGSAVDGAFVYVPGTGTVLTVGTHTLSTTFTPTDTATYTSATKAVTISVVNSSGAPTFVDDPLAVGTTTLKAVHITALRQAIASLRTRSSLDAFTYSDPSLVAGATPVKAVHVAELRTALAAVYTAHGHTPPTYTHPVLTAGATVITAVDIAELRAAVLAVW